MISPSLTWITDPTFSSCIASLLFGETSSNTVSGVSPFLSMNKYWPLQLELSTHSSKEHATTPEEYGSEITCI